MSQYARRSLKKEAKILLDDKLEKCVDEKKVVWWDEGGFLEDVLRWICDEKDIEFLKAVKSPLELRKKSLTKQSKVSLWYIPEAKKERDWFRDIRELSENSDNEVKIDIIDLSARLYDVNRKELINLEDFDYEDVAHLLKKYLNQNNPPTLAEIKGYLITNEQGDPLLHILKEGWQFAREEHIKKEVVELLKKENIDIIKTEDSINEIVNKVKKYATAQLLIKEDLSEDVFPEEYRTHESLGAGNIGYKLFNVLSEGEKELVDEYMGEFWPDIIENISNIWKYIDVPIEGKLDMKLWEEWQKIWNENDYEACRDKAKKRFVKLQNKYGLEKEKVEELPCWLSCWKQGMLLAKMKSKLKNINWDDTKNIDVIYCDLEDGLWKIDRGVREVMFLGAPEKFLPEGHPAKNILSEIRKKYLYKDYDIYLEKLYKKTKISFEENLFSENLKQIHSFWSEKGEILSSSGNIVLMYIDALRYDLAYDLAESLSEYLGNNSTDEYRIKQEKWASVFPTETEFGMGALMPGPEMSFKVELQNNKLKALRYNMRLTKSKRDNMLEDEGWSTTNSLEKGVAEARIAYFDKTIDTYGEQMNNDFENFISKEIDSMTEKIGQFLIEGDWDRGYILTDHGFLLFPPEFDMKSVEAPDECVDLKNRCCAYKKNQETESVDNGLTLDKNNQLTRYFSNDLKINLLINPFQKFSKQGVSSQRYIHSGGMPQEFLLNLVEIERQ